MAPRVEAARSEKWCPDCARRASKDQPCWGGRLSIPYRNDPLPEPAMAHPLFGPEARLMLRDGDTEGMKTFCETLHPATVAEALADEFDVEEVWRFLQPSSIRGQAAIFEYFPLDWQVKMVEGTGRAHMAKLIEQMSHDDRADLLRRLRPRVAEGLLRLVDEADRRDIATLVNYGENTAGALMTTDYAWLPANITVTEAVER